jgi:hypothetical protein
MKNLLIVFFMFLSLDSFAKEKDIVSCTLNLRPTGIWFNQCPPKMVADGVDVWNPGPTPYPQVRVRCVVPEIICVTQKNNLQNELN